MGKFLNGLEDNHHHDCGAVRIGYYSARTHQGILGVALRNYQRDVGIHAECTGIVNHNGSVLGNVLGEFLGGACTGRSERYVHILEIVIMLKKFYFVFLAFECIFGPCAALRSEQHQLVDGEIPFFKNLQELLSYGSACTNNCYFHFMVVLR